MRRCGGRQGPIRRLCGQQDRHVAGYAGTVADSVISRVMEVVLAFPSTLLAIAIVAARGPGRHHLRRAEPPGPSHRDQVLGDATPDLEPLFRA